MASFTLILLANRGDDFIDLADFAQKDGVNCLIQEPIAGWESIALDNSFNPVVIIDTEGFSKQGLIKQVEICQGQDIPFFLALNLAEEALFDELKMLKPAGYFLKPLQASVCLLNIKQKLYDLKTTKLRSDRLEELFVKNGKDYTRISTSDIMWIQANGNYIEIFTSQDNKYLLRIGLKDIEGRLPESQFIRVHKSYILNKKHILKFNSSSVKTTVGELPIARSYFNAVLTAFTVI